MFTEQGRCENIMNQNDIVKKFVDSLLKLILVLAGTGENDLPCGWATEPVKEEAKVQDLLYRAADTLKEWTDGGKEYDKTCRTEELIEEILSFLKEIRLSENRGSTYCMRKGE